MSYKLDTWIHSVFALLSFFQSKSKHQGSIQGFTVAMTDTHSSKGAKPMQRTSRYNIISNISFFFLDFNGPSLFLVHPTSLHTWPNSKRSLPSCPSWTHPLHLLLYIQSPHSTTSECLWWRNFVEISAHIISLLVHIVLHSVLRQGNMLVVLPTRHFTCGLCHPGQSPHWVPVTWPLTATPLIQHQTTGCCLATMAQSMAPVSVAMGSFCSPPQRTVPFDYGMFRGDLLSSATEAMPTQCGTLLLGRENFLKLLVLS